VPISSPSPACGKYLGDETRREYHGTLSRALVDMGKHGLSPLLASTEMKDARVLATVVTVLGDMGYEPAVPYVLRLSASPEAPAAVRQAAAAALAKLNAPGTLAPADAFYRLAEGYYYDKSMITADLSQAPVAFVWHWAEDKGLTKVDVPPVIFNEIMAMRAAEYSLAQDQGKAESLALWLAANYKREVELPVGATDATRAANQPDAHYYGVAAGARYLSDVLDRALRDRNSAVALRAVKSLQLIVGQSSVFSGAGGPASLVSALAYPDRVVRFEAAYTIASALPKQQFAGSDQVVTVLSEMVAQTGKPGVVYIGADSQAVNKMVEALTALGYNAAGASSADGAINAAAAIPAVDAILVSEDAGLSVVDQLLAMTQVSSKLGRTPKVIITKTAQSTYASRAAVDELVNITQSTDPEPLKAAIDKARARGGSNPLDEAAALDAAKRALFALSELGNTGNTVLDPVFGRPAAIKALDDSRAEIVMTAGIALAHIGQSEGQLAILTRATAEGVDAQVQVSLLQSLTVSAKKYGNTLSADAIAKLEKLLQTDASEVRSAAAEARGALNLPPDEARALILKQSRK
jgi:hypothetical protein